jgi:large subunit ribosomal protein L17
MAEYRKLGRTSSQRKAMLRNLATNLLYRGKIVTTVTRAKEVRRIAEKLITVAKKEMNHYDEVTVTAKTPRKNAKGQRVKEQVNGKTVTVYDTVEKTVQKDRPSRLNARRKILSVLYPVTEAPPVNRRARKASSKKSVNMAKMMFDEIAPRYADRNGGYTRIVRLGARKGDAAEMALIELV